MHFTRHAGPDPVSRRSRKEWIPAFAGMTTFLETVSLWTDTKYSDGERESHENSGHR
jgi:hypothetical protein